MARESRILAQFGRNKDKLLVFIADEAECMEMYRNTTSRDILAKDVKLVVLSWQDILTALKTISPENKYEKLMLRDVQRLLSTKGFERFRDFSLVKYTSIDHTSFYKFDGNGFCFYIHQKIEEDLYYEFR